MTGKMSHRGIRALYEQLSEFERGCIILNRKRQVGKIGESLVIWVEAMRPFGMVWQEWVELFNDESRFQLRPDDHRGCVWRSPGQRADPAFTIARRTGPHPGVISGAPFLLTAGPL
ncbi:hypothetical protein TNCV_247001 [Trichonephila clavipes]|nr:hypothetical protein TNCV_247001 [Trichonephila clavipes]